MFLEVAQEVTARYPAIQFETPNVDAMCMWLVKNPRSFDVIVTTNLGGQATTAEMADAVPGAL